jgi:hypothetical protein
MARPVGGESRAPNLFQRITGAFSAPKAGRAARPIEPSVAPRGAGERRRGGSQARAGRRRRSLDDLDVTERAKPRATTTTCRFPRSCVGKPTDAGCQRSPRIFEGPRPLFFWLA